MIVNFMKSPRWRTPINDFIDCHCIEFDEQIEENQHHWNDYHKVNHSQNIGIPRFSRDTDWDGA